ncbi:alpha-N-arabinofuranosidase [Lachnospiraceae bacterium OttesenSCG-928-D06]|nr:alpha-N-arabinofuranosidase [Lachnospiraceae bacterium OttesenSCG-928-D06]
MSKEIEFKIHTEQEKSFIQPELHSHFVEFLGSCIYDGIWVGLESEIPNYKGLRKDVVDAMKALEPSVIRWPGGCYADTYHFRNGIGALEKRPVTYNENFGTFEKDSNQFGTHEFMELCKMVGAKPWLNINMMSGSVEEMRDWMEYCNRSEGTELAKLREKNGSKEAFQVELFGLGNEVWGGGGYMRPSAYADEYRKYATAMPSFSTIGELGKSKIKRIACGPDGNKKQERVRWTKEFFQSLSEYRFPAIDGYDLHFYNWNINGEEKSEVEFGKKEWDKVIAGALELEEVIVEQYELIQEGLAQIPKGEEIFAFEEPKVDLIIGEWGNWHKGAFVNRPALYQQCTMRDAVTTALTLDIFHHHCDKVKMACVAQSINVLNSLILTQGESCILTPNYYVFQMYMVHKAGKVLAISENANDSVHIFASRKGEIISINLINTSYEEEKEVCLCLSEAAECIKITRLAGAPSAYNSVENPYLVQAEEISIKEVIKEDNQRIFRCNMKAASVNVYQFRILT